LIYDEEGLSLKLNTQYTVTPRAGYANDFQVAIIDSRLDGQNIELTIIPN